MAGFDPDLAEIRFGYGRSPLYAPPFSVDAMLAGLAGPDAMAKAHPIEPFETFLTRVAAVQAQFRIRRQNRGTALAEAAMKERNRLNRDARKASAGWMVQSLLRTTHTTTGFRERLVAFWADHFTAQGKRGVVRRATGPYVDDAIRPHIAGQFADLLKAAVMHPLMLHYLDQERSIGPGSKRGVNSGGKHGLNENLAREVLELHTLGVGGPYEQRDVRQLAELFTGMSLDPETETGFKFRKDWAEPGAETVLGKRYGPEPHPGEIAAVLEDLAAHPATAAHIARKLAVHFVADAPPPDLVAHLETRYLATDGDLTAVYAALLDHPAAWRDGLENVKPPVDFVASAMRALAVAPERFADARERDLRQGFLAPFERMGQPWQRPPGPDGWAEADGHWITPQGLAGRITWAMRVPEHLRPDLPDPRRFVDDSLGRFADDRVRFAAGAAERKAEAIGLVLLAPAFQRR